LFPPCWREFLRHEGYLSLLPFLPRRLQLPVTLLENLYLVGTTKADRLARHLGRPGGNGGIRFGPAGTAAEAPAPNFSSTVRLPPAAPALSRVISFRRTAHPQPGR
jgi:hypothetical protein